MTKNRRENKQARAIASALQISYTHALRLMRDISSSDVEKCREALNKERKQ